MIPCLRSGGTKVVLPSPRLPSPLLLYGFPGLGPLLEANGLEIWHSSRRSTAQALTTSLEQLCFSRDMRVCGSGKVF